MKALLSCFLLLTIYTANTKAHAMTPEEIVQQNLDFYNQRDIDGFMSLLSPDIAIFSLGESTPSVAGFDDVKAFYKSMFADSPDLHSTILKRIVIGNNVIDHESIVGRMGSSEVVELVLIYTVEADKIVAIRVIRE